MAEIKIEDNQPIKKKIFVLPDDIEAMRSFAESHPESLPTVWPFKDLRETDDGPVEVEKMLFWITYPAQ